METIDLTDDTVEQLRAFTRHGETPSQAIRRLLADAELDATADATSDEQLAHSVLTVRDLRQMDVHGYTAAEYLREEFGVDPGEHASETSLREALSEGR